MSNLEFHVECLESALEVSDLVVDQEDADVCVLPLMDHMACIHHQFLEVVELSLLNLHR